MFSKYYLFQLIEFYIDYRVPTQFTIIFATFVMIDNDALYYKN